MTEFTPPYAPVVVLLFLGTIFVLGIGLLTLCYGAARRSRVFARAGAALVLLFAGGYFTLLFAVSLGSEEKVIPAGGWKYFCEIDCHIAYSVLGAETSASIGPELQQTLPQGKFVTVKLKSWFDPATISPKRGNGPLSPNPRRVVLVDDLGRAFGVSAAGASAAARFEAPKRLLGEPLRPGESYETDLVFDVPREARGLRLLVTDEEGEATLLVGHENSLLHKKIYLNLKP